MELSNYPTGVIMDAVLEKEQEVIEDDRWEDRLEEVEPMEDNEN